MKRGIAAEFPSEAAIVGAIRTLRADRALREHRIEAYSPIPSHAIDNALGARRSPLAFAAGIGGLFGAFCGYFFQWLLVAYLYPVDVGNRPPHMPLPFTLITIEMGFLLGGITVTVAFIVASRLFKLWEPIFDVPGFESATRAGFWLAVDASDPAIVTTLRDAGAIQIHGFGGIG